MFKICKRKWFYLIENMPNREHILQLIRTFKEKNMQMHKNPRPNDQN